MICPLFSPTIQSLGQDDVWQYSPQLRQCPYVGVMVVSVFGWGYGRGCWCRRSLTPRSIVNLYGVHEFTSNADTWPLFAKCNGYTNRIMVFWFIGMGSNMIAMRWWFDMHRSDFEPYLYIWCFGRFCRSMLIGLYGFWICVWLGVFSMPLPMVFLCVMDVL